MNLQALEASLCAGHVWIAHGDAPDRNGRKVGITVGIRRIDSGLFQVSVDTYYLEGMYGNDISWVHERFDTLSDAIAFMEKSTGIKAQALEKYKPVD